jgi:hypothetical protein
LVASKTINAPSLLNVARADIAMVAVIFLESGQAFFAAVWAGKQVLFDASNTGFALAMMLASILD